MSLSGYKIAIVIGGSETVFSEIEQARLLTLPFARENIELFVINDTIPILPDHIHHAVTLHPVKLADWLHKRRQNGYPPPGDIWAHRKNLSNEANINFWTDDWGGSSGLLAVKVATQLNFDKIILCGVPMDTGKHFLRQTGWNACFAFRRGWERQMRDLLPYVRSYSGWTRDQLGEPTADFLTEIPSLTTGPR